eukprot:comp20004_c0_seq1/m.24490 comp20004_c0_seq1/g.24490  ORF comp20004_c0_seq1/g.24490 comp20004_c0_seq1/m.24490 type:complete len:149 (-) comp20004_c0_seq1:83-529(-)
MRQQTETRHLLLLQQQKRWALLRLKFVYISAAGAPPMVDKRYITTKREAEAALQAMNGFDTVILRPGFMYSEDDIFTHNIGLSLRTTHAILSPFLRPLTGKMINWDELGLQALNVSTVGQAVVQAVLSPGCKGVFDIDGISYLAQQAN